MPSAQALRPHKVSPLLRGLGAAAPPITFFLLTWGTAAQSAFSVLVVALTALPLALRRDHILLGAGVLCLVCCGLALSHGTAPASLLEPLQAQRAGQASLVLVVGSLAAGGIVLLPSCHRRHRRPLAVTLAVSWTGAWAAHLGIAILALTFAGVSLLARRSIPARLSRVPQALGLGALAVAGGCVLLSMLPPAQPQPLDDRGLALYWEARDNPFRALLHARAWAAHSPFGEAHLCLARLAHRLGDAEEAQAILQDVASRAESGALRARAVEALGALR